MYFGNMFFLYLFVLSGMFLLMLIIYVSFYFVAMELIQSLDQRKRIQLMQMQEHQYIAQQTYIEESSRIRPVSYTHLDVYKRQIQKGYQGEQSKSN